jgi:hypothetical protein
MAKSWKSFVKKDDDLSQDPGSSQELSGIETDLNLSLEDLAKSNEQLRAILEERNALEEKMRQLTNPAERQGQRFDSSIDSISRKRREDLKQFSDKQKLEEKLRLKKEELNYWTKKIKSVRDKVTLTKDRFDRKKEELHRVKRKVDEFVKKVRSGPAGDFDYEKFSGPLKKAVGDFPFTEKMTDRTDEIFNRPVAQITGKITERAPVKKIADTWEEIKEKKREAAKIKEKFDALMKKKDGLFEFDDFGAKFMDGFGSEDPEKSFKEKKDQPAEKNEEQEKKKQSLFERLKERRKAKKSGEKVKKPKDITPGDVEELLKGKREEKRPAPEKDKEEEEALARHDKKRSEKREQRIATRKEARRKALFGEEIPEKSNETGNNAVDDSTETVNEKKIEQNDLEKKEEQRQEKIKDRIAQKREARREARQEEERHEKRKRVKDKFD